MHLRLPQLLLGLAAVAIIATGIFYSADRFGGNSAQKNANVKCAFTGIQVCPDGSLVGRLPGTCEFAACPAANTNAATNVNAVTNTNTASNTNTTADATKDWKTVHDEFYGLTWKIPASEVATFSHVFNSLLNVMEYTGAFTAEAVLQAYGPRVGLDEVTVTPFEHPNGDSALLILGKSAAAKAEGLRQPTAFIKHGSILFITKSTETGDASSVMEKVKSMQFSRTNLPGSVACMPTSHPGLQTWGRNERGDYYFTMVFANSMDQSWIESSGQFAVATDGNTPEAFSIHLQSFPPEKDFQLATVLVKKSDAKKSKNGVTLYPGSRHLKLADGRYCGELTLTSTRFILDTSTTGWTLYTNDAKKFSLRVPPDWMGFRVTESENEVTIRHPASEKLWFRVVRTSESEVENAHYLTSKDGAHYFMAQSREQSPTAYVPEGLVSEADEMDLIWTTFNAL